MFYIYINNWYGVTGTGNYNIQRRQITVVKSLILTRIENIQYEEKKYSRFKNNKKKRPKLNIFFNKFKG